MSHSKVYDKLGNAYELEVVEDETHAITYEVYDGSILAGVVRAKKLNAKEVFLNHIVITKMPEDKTGRWWSRTAPLPKYRKRGLGTFLLRHFMEDSYQRGFERILASVSREDMENQPYLLDWYRQHNFVVKMLTNPEGTTAAEIRYETKVAPG